MRDARLLSRGPIHDAGAIVILATQRSGSTLLCDAFHRVGFGRGDEHILNFVPAAETGMFLDGTYGPRLTQRFSAARLGRMGLRGGRYCIKIMANYLHSFCGLCCDRAPLHDAGWQADVLQAAFPGSLFVFLTRTDRLAQAISRAMATQSGVCHTMGALSGYIATRSVDADYNRSVIFRASEISEHLSSIDHDNRVLREVRGRLRDRGAATQTMLYDGRWFAAGDRSGQAPPAAAAAIGTVLALPPQAARLKKLANRYNCFFEIAYRAYRESTRGASSGSEIDPVHATIAALATCSDHDADWVRMQAAFIEHNAYV